MLLVLSACGPDAVIGWTSIYLVDQDVAPCDLPEAIKGIEAAVGNAYGWETAKRVMDTETWLYPEWQAVPYPLDLARGRVVNGRFDPGTGSIHARIVGPSMVAAHVLSHEFLAHRLFWVTEHPSTGGHGGRYAETESRLTEEVDARAGDRDLCWRRD